MTADAARVVEARDLGRSFDTTRVIEGVNLSIDPGEMFGLVGPSGCGKTTLVSLIVGLLRPTEGELTVLGVPPVDFGRGHRAAIGYLPQSFSLFPMLTVEENARFAAATYGVGWFRRGGRIREFLTLFDLWDARSRRADRISGGMQRRLGLVCALLHAPQFLLVDEPTAGLDPELRARIWDYLKDAQASGTTVLMTTQYIEEAERCDRVAVMRDGRIAASDTPDDLRTRAQVPARIVIRADDLTPADIAALWAIPQVHEVARIDDGTRLLSSEPDRVAAAALSELTERERTVHSIEVERPSFEDVYQALVSAAVPAAVPEPTSPGRD